MYYIIWQVLKDIDGIDAFTKVAIVLVVVAVLDIWRRTL